jgi:Uma2 family endonuclease
MNTARKIDPLMTVEEFLRWPGDGTGRRRELVDGVVRMQDAASDAHGTIQSRLIAIISNHLDATRPHCRVVANPGVSPRLNTDWNYREPDLGVTCAPNRPDVHTLPEPILLIEILSPSNADKTWSNIPLYATLPSVAEILIVNSTEVLVQLLRRQEDGNWPQRPAGFGAGQSVRLTTIDLEIPLRDMYRQTHLADSAG